MAARGVLLLLGDILPAHPHALPVSGVGGSRSRKSAAGLGVLQDVRVKHGAPARLQANPHTWAASSDDRGPNHRARNRLFELPAKPPWGPRATINALAPRATGDREVIRQGQMAGALRSPTPARQGVSHRMRKAKVGSPMKQIQTAAPYEKRRNNNTRYGKGTSNTSRARTAALSRPHSGRQRRDCMPLLRHRNQMGGGVRKKHASRRIIRPRTLSSISFSRPHVAR
jgi:hypothetical protein